MPKFIFVTGGVLSSLGKGILVSSLARLLKGHLSSLGKGILVSSLARLLKGHGVNASAMKIDPYLNCDAGTLNPFEHGEVFVTNDGFECDLDVGNYERFLDIFVRSEQNFMMGSVYKTIVEEERRGGFLGKTVQLIPHATNEIKRRIRLAAGVTGCDVLFVEIGGTVGDIESEIVLEAARQMKFDGKHGDVVFVHLALVPRIITGEQKTKPFQHSVKALLSRGITPDILVARSDEMVSEAAKEKISLQCNVRKEDVFCSPSLKNIYALPLVLQEQGIHLNIAAKMGLKLKKKDLKQWTALVKKMDALAEKGRKVSVGVVGKYATMKDTYMSIFEAIRHAGLANGVCAEGVLIDSDDIESKKTDLNGFDALLVPGGFGSRGVEGKITAIRFAREKKKPLLGICYGFQLSVIEFARNVLGWKDADTTENNSRTRHPVIDILPEQKTVKEKGGTMRLGAQKTLVKPGTLAHKMYGANEIWKRHRHRYEVNPDAIGELEKAGLVFSGRSGDGRKMEILELPGQCFIGSQYHPEFDSRLGRPEPMFNALVKAALKRV
ncbi:MAG: CTP synthase [Candidatus Micrarchaeota archaeon]|nr:CTP synthase [Candidatus Micrarchaeota archaeon]